MSKRNQEIDPTPEEIRQQCEAIQAEWSEETRHTRAAWAGPPHWTVPEVTGLDVRE